MFTETERFEWFAVHVRSRCERMVATQFDAKGLSSIVPVYHEEKRWTDRRKQIETPLFPGYVFCRFDAGHPLAVLNTAGVVQIVGVGKRPVAIDEVEMRNLQRLATTGLRREPAPMFTSGQTVTIAGGPLRGVTGTVVRHQNKCKVMLSVTLLQRGVAVEVDAEWLMPLSGDCAQTNLPQVIVQ